MDKIEFLPLGSIVIPKGGTRKILIIARGIAANISGTVQYFDYGAVLYPQGMMDDQLLYLNHEQIAKVVFHGYSDEEDQYMIDNIHEWLKQQDYPKGDPVKLNAEANEKETG